MNENEIKKIESELTFIPQYEDLDEIPTGSSIRMLGFGGPGTGKTEFVLTMGEGTCLINLGRGEETLKNLGAKSRNKNAKLTVVDLNKVLDKKDGSTPEPIEMINAISDSVYHAITVKGFKKIAIDDMTEYRTYALLQALKINKEQGKSKSYDFTLANDGLMMPVVQDFGTEMNLVEDFLRWLCNEAYDREFHVYITAHTRAIYRKSLDAKGSPIIGEPKVLVRELPGFTGETFPDNIPRLFSIVGMFNQNGVNKDGDQRIRLYLQGDSTRRVKHRYSGILPEFLDNPRFDKIEAAIKSNQKLINS